MKPTRYKFGMTERAKNYYNQLTWQEICDVNAQKYPTQEAFVDTKARFTWSEVKEWTDRVAWGLIKLGLKKDDIVALQLPNIAEAMLLRTALRKAGIVGFVAGIGLREMELEYIMGYIKPIGAVFLPKYRDRDYFKVMLELKQKVPSLEFIFTVGDDVPPEALSIKDMSQRPLPSDFRPDLFTSLWIDRFELHEVWTTSGTTGMPKILESLNYAMSFSRYQVPRYKVEHQDIIFMLSPHSGGVAATAFAMSLPLGAELVMQPSFESEEAFQIIEKERVTFIVAVPTQLEMMVRHPSLGKYDFSSLRTICYTGAFLSSATALEVEDKFGCRVISHYGGVEFSTLSSPSLDDELEVRRNSIGKPFPLHEGRVVDESDNDVPLGEVGELLVKTPNTGGIFKDYEATMQAWGGEPDGWFHTGDLAKMDAEGNYYITGRIKDIIKRGGYSIAPAEVENILITHPKVVGVAIVPMPDLVMGEKACAYVVSRPGETLAFEEMIAFLREKKIASYKLPERLELISEFPVSSGGKVLKRELVADITSKLKAEGKIPYA